MITHAYVSLHTHALVAEVFLNLFREHPLAGMSPQQAHRLPCNVKG